VRKIRYNKDVDALLVELSSEPVDHAEGSERFIVHSSRTGELVLLEILDAREFVLGSLSSLLKETEAILP
jgi:uncharacterized protein YuzE